MINKFFLLHAKKRLLVIVIFLCLSAFLMNTGLMLVTDYQANFQREHDRLRAGHIVLNFRTDDPEAQSSTVANALQKRQDVEAFEIRQTLTFNGSCAFGEGILDSDFTFLPQSVAEAATVGQYEIVARGEEEGVYLPYLFSVNGYLQIGDIFSLQIGDKTVSFPVKGFYHHLTTGTVNCRDVTVLLPDSQWELQRLAFPGQTSLRVSLRLTDGSRAESMEADILACINGEAQGLYLVNGTNVQKLSANRYITETICMGIVVGATVISVVALLAVICITLSDIVRKNIRNLGALKAMGYVSRRLIFPVMASFGLLGLLSSAIGIAGSYLFFPVLNEMLEKQVGIPYRLSFLPLPALLTLGAVLLTVWVSVYLSIAGIRRIQPIMAIRMEKGKGRGNRAFPLYKTRLPLDAALSAKSAIGGLKSNLIVLLAVFLVSLLLGFDCFCYQYIVQDPNGLMLGVFGNLSDATVVVDARDREAFLTFARKDDRTEAVYLYGSCDVCHDGNYRLTANIIDAETPKHNGEICVAGHLPEGQDEVAVNVYYARLFRLELGDSMSLSFGSGHESYRVCGIFQDASRSGRNVMLTESGAERMGEMPYLTYSVLLREGTDIDGFLRDTQEAVHPVKGVNFRSFVEGMSASYVSMLTAVSFFVFGLSLAIIVLILYIVITITLDRKRREHGVFKALGLHTGRIVLQTALSLLPFGTVGTVLGLWVARGGVASFLSLLLRGIGLASMGGVIATPILVLCGGVLVLILFGTACLMCRQIRHIVPHDLFNRE